MFLKIIFNAIGHSERNKNGQPFKFSTTLCETNYKEKRKSKNYTRSGMKFKVIPNIKTMD